MSTDSLGQSNNEKSDTNSRELIFEEVPLSAFGISTTEKQTPDTADLDSKHALDSGALGNEVNRTSDSEPVPEEVPLDVDIYVSIQKLIERRGFDSAKLRDTIRKYWKEYTAKSTSPMNSRLLECFARSTVTTSDHTLYLVTTQKIVGDGFFRDQRMVQTHYFFYADVLTDFEYDMLCGITEAINSKSSKPQDAYKSVLFDELLQSSFFQKYRQWMDSQPLEDFAISRQRLDLQIFSSQLCGSAYMKRLDYCREQKSDDENSSTESAESRESSKGELFQEDNHIKDPNLSVTLIRVTIPEKHVVDAGLKPVRRILEGFVDISNRITKVSGEVECLSPDASEHPLSEQERHRSAKRHKPCVMPDSVDVDTATE